MGWGGGQLVGDMKVLTQYHRKLNFTTLFFSSGQELREQVSQLMKEEEQISKGQSFTWLHPQLFYYGLLMLQLKKYGGFQHLKGTRLHSVVPSKTLLSQVQ